MSHSPLRAATATGGGFFVQVSRRLELRWVVIRYSVVAVIFWTVAIIAGAWLRHWGLGWLVWSLFAVWGYFALPAFAAQCALIADILLYAVTSRTPFFPNALELIESGELDRQRDELPASARGYLRATEKLFTFAGDTTPLVGVALWAVIVPIRMPEAAHAPQRARTREDLRRAIQVAHRIEFSVVEGFTRKQFAMAV